MRVVVSVEGVREEEERGKRRGIEREKKKRTWVRESVLDWLSSSISKMNSSRFTVSSFLFDSWSRYSLSKAPKLLFSYLVDPARNDMLG